MDGSENNNALPHIILNDRSQLEGLDSIHPGKTIIVRLNDAEDGASQILHNYRASINNQENNSDETEIAFEIIQEPLLNDAGVVDNRLFFEQDYNNLERVIPPSKDTVQLQTTSINQIKEESQQLLITSGVENHNNAPGGYLVVTKDPTEHDTSKNVSTLEFLPTSTVALSSLQNGATSGTDTDAVVKLELPDSENNEIRTNSDIIKNTTVEAFVKMIVCRKITVQKKDAKTGELLDENVKMEEEEPVVLGVDYVETTEDIISGNRLKQNVENLKSTKDATDTGIKALSSILETGSNKAGKNNFFTNPAVQSALKKKVSKVLQSDNTSLPQSSGKSENKNLSKTCDDKRDVVNSNSESDSEWTEDFNDNSADYVPYPSSKQKQPEVRQRRSLKNYKTENIGEETNSAVDVEKEDMDINIPKKRGRKRKWDRTIGLASNMKICQFCNKHFDSVSSCSKHMKNGNCVSSQFCFICSKTFDSEQKLEIHISSHRNENKRTSYDCPDCKRSYRTKAGYVKHFRMGTCKKREIFEDGERGDFTCKFCDSRFSTLDYLQLHHYKVHENPKDKHVCPNCGKTFYSLQGFQRHRSGRPCTESLKCHICGKTYRARESFKLHMKHHKSEITGVTFNCDECSRSYMTEAALTKHKLLHTGVKPYKCDVCGKEFAMRYQVKDHARMHSGEKPYSCNLCKVSFSNKGHLGRHLRSHENGTLLKKGRPKKIQNPATNTTNNNINNNSASAVGETKINIGQTLKTIDGQTIQVIDSGQIFNGQGDCPTPMIIQADSDTIIIAEGWPDSAIPVSVSQPLAVSNNTVAMNGS